MVCVGGYLLGAASGRRSHAAVSATLAVLFGIGAASAFYHNKRITDDMSRIAAVWDSARILVCSDGLPADGLDRFFDPADTVDMHPGVDRAAFWAAYRDHFRPGCTP